MEKTVERDPAGYLHGEAPANYRMVFEIDPPLLSHKKGKVKGDGREISRVEFFAEDERSFYFIHAAISRLANITRAEAIILTEDSVVTWRDRNKNEKE